MPRHLYLVPGADDLASGVNEKGAAVDPHILFAVHGLFHPDSVGLGNLLAFIGSEREVELLFVTELCMAVERVLEMPTMSVLAASNSDFRSRKSLDSVVQPGVMSLG